MTVISHHIKNKTTPAIPCIDFLSKIHVYFMLRSIKELKSGQWVDKRWTLFICSSYCLILNPTYTFCDKKYCYLNEKFNINTDV